MSEKQGYISFSAFGLFLPKLAFQRYKSQLKSYRLLLLLSSQIFGLKSQLRRRNKQSLSHLIQTE
jgi:hypothetical protein